MQIDALPPAHEIDHPEIRQAAEQHQAARQQLKERQRAVRDLDDGREKAEWLDAKAAEEAIAAGKPTPKRHHVADHAKKVDDLEHEIKVAKLAADRARGDLQAVLNEHGAAWVESLASRAEDLEHEWDKSVAALISLYGERMAVGARIRRVGGETPDVGFLRMQPAQLLDSLSGQRLELAYHPDGGARQRRRALIGAGDALAALANLGVKEEITVVSPGLGEAVARAVEHVRTIERGYAVDEESAPGVNERYVVAGGRRATVHMPSAGGDD